MAKTFFILPPTLLRVSFGQPVKIDKDLHKYVNCFCAWTVPQSFPITSDRPTGKTEVGPAKYPTTSDLQSGYFLASFVFFNVFFVSPGKNRLLPTYCLVNFFWSGKSFKFTGPTVQWIFELIGKDWYRDMFIISVHDNLYNLCFFKNSMAQDVLLVKAWDRPPSMSRNLDN